MAQGSFTARVRADVAKAKELMLAVRNESVQRIVEIAQTPKAAGGNMRVDTGFLRASLMATIGDANFTLKDKPDGEARYSWDAGQVGLVILGADIKDPITVVYTASYARPREYGARGQAGDRFVGLAAQQWQRVVDEVSAEARTRAGL